MRAIVHLVLGLGFFSLAAAFDGTPLYYLFAAIGFLIFTSAFKKPAREAAPKSRELSLFEIRAQERASCEAAKARHTRAACANLSLRGIPA